MLRHRRGRKSRRGRRGSIRKDTVRKSEERPRKRTKKNARRQKERAMTRRDRGRTSETTVKLRQEKEGAQHTEDRPSHQKLDRKERGRGQTGYPGIARGPEREEREATGLEKKTRERPPGTPKHEELKPETLEKGYPGLEPTREQRPKRPQKATKGPEDHPKISRRNTRGRERDRGRSKRK